MINGRTLTKLALTLVAAALLFLLVFSGVKIAETVFRKDKAVDTSASHSKTIEVDGIEYFPRQDISVFMLMGIDRSGAVKPSTSYNNDGAADLVSLIVFDNTNETFDVLMLNRDTMLEMPVLGVKGQKAGTVFAQLALSHTYGDGMEQSCLNVKDTVSSFLNNIEIDHYMSMNMDAVAILTDAVGGVKVNVTEDFSEVDPEIPMGETVLRGVHALNFVRNRKEVGDQMNLSRMTRQREFMKGFMEAVRLKFDNNEQLALDMFDSIKDYSVTDCNGNAFNTIINRCSDYTLKEIITPEGENKTGTEYMEFYPDKDKLKSLILRLFYQPKPQF